MENIGPFWAKNVRHKLLVLSANKWQIHFIHYRELDDIKNAKGETPIVQGTGNFNRQIR
jgi:hypothetical protein